MDPLIKSHQTVSHNPLSVTTYGESHSALAPPLVPATDPSVLADPDLVRLIHAWDTMPENMKAVIRSMASLALPAVKPTTFTIQAEDRIPREPNG